MADGLWELDGQNELSFQGREVIDRAVARPKGGGKVAMIRCFRELTSANGD